MKILNVKGVKTISKSQQQSISGGDYSSGSGTWECYYDCRALLKNQPGTDQEKHNWCLNDCALFT